MIGGVERYADYCALRGVEPQYIKQPETFFGPGMHFDSDWSAPAARAAGPSKQEALEARNAEVARRFLESMGGGHVE